MITEVQAYWDNLGKSRDKKYNSNDDV